MVSQSDLIINFFLGLGASFSPCLFPLLPSYVAVTMKSEKSKKTSLISSLALITGILIVFFSLGQIFDLVGSQLIKNYSSLATIQAVLLVIAGTLLIRTPSIMYKIKLPSRFESMLYREDDNRNLYYFNFLIGLAYTIIAAPCAGGFFLTTWTMLIGESLINQFFITLFFSLGAGLPFIIMSLYIPTIRADLVANIHDASNKIFKVLGIVLISVGIWLYVDVTNQF